MYYQKEISLQPKKRGYHLITDEILEQLPEIKKVTTGIINIFIKHTSASLTINENYDPTVRTDMENYFNRTVKENEPYYVHTSEGADDMPAHIKSTIIGSSVSIPVSNGKLNLGTWQGLYLCEHRNHSGSRRIVLTLLGEESS